MRGRVRVEWMNGGEGGDWLAWTTKLQWRKMKNAKAENKGGRREECQAGSDGSQTHRYITNMHMFCIRGRCRAHHNQIIRLPGRWRRVSDPSLRRIMHNFSPEKGEKTYICLSGCGIPLVIT